MTGTGRRQPLAGVRVLDFTWAWAGAYATFLLGQLGAEIIKVESVQRLDLSRTQSLTTGQRFAGYDSSTVFNDLNLNKRSVRLNLARTEGVAIARRLVRISDVVAQNMRPGVMERLGLGYEDLCREKIDIIMLSSSAVGSTGPYRTDVGYAPVFAALSGLAQVTGSPGGLPVPLYGAIDLRSATMSAFAVLAALHQKARTGVGQHIDLSSVESITSLAGHLVAEYEITGRAPYRRGNRDRHMAPHNSYPCCAGQWVSIAVETDEEWLALCRVAGKPEWVADERFVSAESRRRHEAALDALVRDWTRQRTAQDVTKLLQQAGIAAFPCLGAEGLAADPQIEARGVISTIEHPVIGTREIMGPPWHFARTPPVDQQPAPLLGEHNAYTLGELLGMSAGDIAELEQQGIVC